MTSLAVIERDTGEVVGESSGPLAMIEQGYALLAGATTIEEIMAIRDKAEALRHYSATAQLGLKTQNVCAALKIRAERKAGELLRQMQLHNGDPRSHDATRLSDLDINKSQSSRWQKVAEIPEDTFEEHLTDTAAASRELTTAGVLQLARLVKAQDITEHPPLGNAPEGRGLVGLTGTFRTIIADPPWQYGNASTRNAAAKHYLTMTIDELCSLDVSGNAADDAHLYLWTTTSFLREAFDVMDAWGFTYKTNLVWAKTAFGLGNYFRVSHEHVLFGVRGSLNIPPADRVKTWFESGRGRHSAKPDVFLDIVEKCSPGPGLEMFARNDGRPVRFDVEGKEFHWTYWGNEA